jgi:preprotein translocase subunit SecF
MRHPQRLDIRLLGTQIRAEGVLGILGAIAVIAVVMSFYFRT